MRTIKKSTKKIPKDEQVRAVKGARFRWSGSSLRRFNAVIVGEMVLYKNGKRWIEIEKDEPIYKSRKQAIDSIQGPATTYYLWNENKLKIEKIFKKVFAGGRVAYYPAGADPENYWGGDYTYRSYAAKRKLFRTRKQAVKRAIAFMTKKASQQEKSVFAWNKKLEALKKQL